MDYKSCFDSLWADEVTNDLFEAGVTDEKLALIHKINEIDHIRVITPVGLSDVNTVENIVCQGDPWGSTEWMVDGFGRDSLNPELEPFKYKKMIPVLGMVDDVLTV